MKTVSFPNKGQFMKRIIRSNAFETSVTTVNVNNLSESLQTMLNQPPSFIAYLLLLSSVLFIAMVLTWVWNARIEEVRQIRGKLVFINSEKVQQAAEMPRSSNIAETQFKQNDSHLAITFDVQDQKLTEIQTKLNQINALMVHTYLADSTNTRKPVRQSKSALRFITLEADNTNALKFDTANLFSNTSNILFPKVTQNRFIQLNLQQKIQQKEDYHSCKSS
jgi:hypothetical protein